MGSQAVQPSLSDGSRIPGIPPGSLAPDSVRTFPIVTLGPGHLLSKLHDAGQTQADVPGSRMANYAAGAVASRLN